MITFTAIREVIHERGERIYCKHLTDLGRIYWCNNDRICNQAPCQMKVSDPQSVDMGDCTEFEEATT